jgi:hypothetical protein
MGASEGGQAILAARYRHLREPYNLAAAAVRRLDETARIQLPSPEAMTQASIDSPIMQERLIRLAAAQALATRLEELAIAAAGGVPATALENMQPGRWIHPKLDDVTQPHAGLRHLAAEFRQALNRWWEHQPVPYDRGGLFATNQPRRTAPAFRALVAELMQRPAVIAAGRQLLIQADPHMRLEVSRSSGSDIPPVPLDMRLWFAGVSFRTIEELHTASTLVERAVVAGAIPIVGQRLVQLTGGPKVGFPTLQARVDIEVTIGNDLVHKLIPLGLVDPEAAVTRRTRRSLRAVRTAIVTRMGSEAADRWMEFRGIEPGSDNEGGLGVGHPGPRPDGAPGGVGMPVPAPQIPQTSVSHVQNPSHHPGGRPAADDLAFAGRVDQASRGGSPVITPATDADDVGVVRTTQPPIGDLLLGADADGAVVELEQLVAAATAPTVADRPRPGVAPGRPL